MFSSNSNVGCVTRLYHRRQRPTTTTTLLLLESLSLLPGPEVLSLLALAARPGAENKRNPMFKFVATLLAVALLVRSASAGTEPTALDEYVWAADEHYSWFDTGETLTGKSLQNGVGWTGYVLNMTSGQWLTEEEVGDRYMWWHILVVVIPDNLNPDFAANGTLWITGNKNTGDGVPSATDEDMLVVSEIACGVGLPVASLFQVPNEPIVFADDPTQKSRSEDAIIAYTWDHYLRNPEDTEWLLRMPMVRASLRAMDTMTAFLKQKIDIQVDYYGVAGASKRGWTTWLVGAVDPDRVMAIAPVVLDAINFVQVEHHQARSYGGWSYALQDYYDMDIMTRLDIPEMVALQYLVDPYFYRERLTMPKFIFNAVMDEFQQPDDSWYWWDEMPEPKWFQLNPNTEHSYITGIFEALPAMGTWLYYLLMDYEIPTITWDINNSTGDITVWTQGGEVAQATMWYATTCTNQMRDYRIATLQDPCPCGPTIDGYCSNLKSVWYKEELQANEDGSYTAHMDAPDHGKWGAFLVSVQFEDDRVPNTKANGGHYGWPYTPPGMMEFTTEVSIVPNTFPYPDCYLDTCDLPIV